MWIGWPSLGSASASNSKGEAYKHCSKIENSSKET